MNFNHFLNLYEKCQNEFFYKKDWVLKKDGVLNDN